MCIISYYMKIIIKKSHNRNKVSYVKKVIKIIIIILFVLFLIIGGLSLYIGNYLYNYTLNPNADDYLGMSIEDNDNDKAKKWLKENGQDVYMRSQDNLRLKATLIEQDSHTYVIMVHGYRGDGASIIAPIKKMKEAGYSLLVPDLRGHGESEGDYIGMGCDDRLDILEWIRFLLNRDKNASIVLYGVSMGAATVMNVAGENIPDEVKCIIEDCGYTNVWDLFQAHFDMNRFESAIVLRAGSLVTKIRAGYNIMDNQPIQQIQKSQRPILFIHGDEDDFVPFSMVDKLYNAAKCEKEKLVIQGAGHANSCAINPKLYYQTIFDFIEKYTKKHRSAFLRITTI